MYILREAEHYIQKMIEGGGVESKTLETEIEKGLGKCDLGTTRKRVEKERKKYDSERKKKRRAYELKRRRDKEGDFIRRQRKRNLAIERRKTKDGNEKMTKNNEKRKFDEEEKKKAKRKGRKQYEKEQRVRRQRKEYLDVWKKRQRVLHPFEGREKEEYEKGIKKGREKKMY